MGGDTTNIANFGTNKPVNNDISSVHATKIDFDMADPGQKVTADNYEQDILSKLLYSKDIKGQLEAQYLFEKLNARAKLAITSTELAIALANKSYAPQAQEAKKHAISEVQSRTNRKIITTT